MSLFLIILIGIGWFFSQAYSEPIILYAIVVFSIVMNVVSYWFSDKIALAVSGAKPLVIDDDRELYNIVENLSITAGLPMPKVYVIDDPVPNAFATGRDKEHSAVAVTTGLRRVLSRTELEGVIAHELSHIGNRDILISTIAVVLVGLVALVSDMFIRMGMFGHGNRDNNKGGVIVLVGFILAILSPIAATIIQLAVSRKREYLADASGVLLTRYPEGLASALEKIAKYSGEMKRANNATAHLYISNPFGVHPGRMMANLFSTHPPIEERIRILREL